MIHWLKTVQPHFDDVWNGDKPYEIRNNDRMFLEGDLLILAEGTGDGRAPRTVVARVKQVLSRFEGLTDGYVALGLQILGRMSDDEFKLYEHHATEITSKEWTCWRRASEVRAE